MEPDVLVDGNGEREKLRDEDRNIRLDFPSSRSCFEEYSLRYYTIQWNESSQDTSGGSSHGHKVKFS